LVPFESVMPNLTRIAFTSVYRFGPSTKAGACRPLSVIPAPSPVSILAKIKLFLEVTMVTYGYGHSVYDGWMVSHFLYFYDNLFRWENSDVFSNTNTNMYEDASNTKDMTSNSSGVSTKMIV
jgi:hypothetical protein